LRARSNQPFSGKLGALNLTKVALVKERELKPLSRHHPANLRRPQGRDPAHPGDDLKVLAQASRSDHPAVPDKDNPAQTKALANLLHLRAQSHRIGGVAGEYLDGDRAPFPIAEQAEDDLQLPPLAIPRVAETSQRAATALEIRRGHIVEHQTAVLQVAASQALLNGALLHVQPIHRRIQLDLVDLGQVQILDQSAQVRFLTEAAGSGKLGAGLQDASDDHRHHQIALRTRLRRDLLVQLELAQSPQHGGDMSVGPAADHLEALGEILDDRGAPQQRAQAIDRRRRQLGEVGQGPLAHLAALAEGLAQEDARLGVAVGHNLDVHGYS
jgi:hypothetical protein